METATQTTETKRTFIDVTIKVRLAEAKDFRVKESTIGENGELIEIIKPKLGQPYWVKSMHTGKFDNRNYQISEDTNWPEFKAWLRQEMVYVPAGIFEIKDHGHEL